jgi:hypothetical protein
VSVQDRDDVILALRAQVEELTRESAGRLKVLEEKAAESKSEWLRAEKAAAKLALVVGPLERFRPLSDMNRSDPNPYWVAIREALAAAREQPTQEPERYCPVGCGSHEDPGPWHQRGCARWRDQAPADAGPVGRTDE